MQIRSKLEGLVKRFGTSQGGAIAVLYAISAIPIFVAAGSAVDYIRYVANVTELQAALIPPPLPQRPPRKPLTLSALIWLRRPLPGTSKAVTSRAPQLFAALIGRLKRSLPLPTWTWQHR